MPSSDDPLQISTSRKLILCIVCSFAISSVSLAFKKAEEDGIAFNPMAASFFSEIFKIVIALVLALKSGGSFSQIRLSPIRQTCIFIVPAFLYVLTNNLRYFIFRLVNPGVIGVMWNLKIVVVGVLYQCPPFRRPLMARQWVGIVLLMFGSAVADSSQWAVSSEEGESNSGGVLGLAVLLLGVILASCSAVSCEFAYKSTAEYMDFPAQCLVLYGMGAVLNFTAFMVNESSHNFSTTRATGNTVSFPHSLIEGFNTWAWIAVVNISLVGFLIGLIFKYIDSIAQVFSDMSAMFLTSFMSWLLFSLQFNIQFFLALILCSVSILVYYGVISKWLFGPDEEVREGYEKVELVDMPLMMEDFLDDELDDELSDNIDVNDLNTMLEGV